MTTNLAIERSLSAKDAGFRFAPLSEVAVISITNRRDDMEVSFRSLLKDCLREFERVRGSWNPVLLRHAVYLFAATTPSFEHNAISRKRGLWGTAELSWLSRGQLMSSSLEMPTDDGLRFCGLARIGSQPTLDSAEYCRTHRNAFLFLSSCENVADDRVRTIASSVLRPDSSSIDWTGLLERFADGDEMAFRIHGGFDDRELSLDIFMPVQLMRRLDVP